MDPGQFTRIAETAWRIEPQGTMRVPVIVYADEALIRDMDDKVSIRATILRTLPASCRLVMLCPTRIGVTASPSVVLPLSTPTKAAWSRPAASALIYPAACAPC